MISYKNSLNILKKSQLKIGDEIISSSNCLDRVSSLNIYNKIDNPAANNAAFDGFAINSSDTKNLNNKLDEITNRISSYSPNAVKNLKKLYWKNTDHWYTLLPKNAEITARLVLEEAAQKILKNL